MSNEKNSLIINQAVLRALNFQSAEDALGKPILFGDGDDASNTVIGVMQDFNWLSAAQPIGPLVLALTPTGNSFSIRLAASRLSETLRTIRTIYDEVFPNNPFDYFFLDAHFQKQYEADQRFGTLFALALFGIFIACLGLIGLSALTASKRTKEIGIRKAPWRDCSECFALADRGFCQTGLDRADADRARDLLQRR